jgi:hypothetical protein
VLVVVGGPGPTDPTDRFDPTAALRTTAAAVVPVSGSERDVEGAVDRAVRDHTADLVLLVRATTRGLTDHWFERVAATLDRDQVVAAAPVLVHPARPLAAATEHDLLVRSAGLAVRAGADGVPVATAVDAGEAVGPGGIPHPVDAVTAAALVVERAAYLSAGGLASLGDLDAAVADLCVRLRGAGGDVLVVPDALVTDGSPVVDRAALTTPIDPAGGAWRRVVERQGARLLPPGPTTFAITVAAPSAKVAPHWGDWHLARALAAGLERLGHPVRVQTADQADSLAGRACAVHVVVRGLAPVTATPGQRHVLWIISHPEDVDDAECDAADLVVVASSRFADHLRSRTTTPVEVLLQATDPSAFHPMPPAPRHRHDVTVVARSRDVMRPAVADALAAGLRPAVYGSGWGDKVPAGLVVAEHVDHDDLPAVYASAGVVLNDHWDTMRTWGFVSNRIFDVAACGTPVLSDDLPELHELFDDLVGTWRTPDELAAAVTALRSDPDAAAARAARLRAVVLAGHTFDHRAQELLAHLRAHLSLT